MCLSLDLCDVSSLLVCTFVFSNVLSALTLFSHISKDVQSVKFLCFKLLFSLHFTSHWLLSVIWSGVNVLTAQMCSTTATVCNMVRCECAQC